VGSPAAKAGLVRGEAITSVAGKPTATSEDLASVLASLTPGQAVDVAIARPDGTTTTVPVTLAELPG